MKKLIFSLFFIILFPISKAQIFPFGGEEVLQIFFGEIPYLCYGNLLDKDCLKCLAFSKAIPFLVIFGLIYLLLYQVATSMAGKTKVFTKEAIIPKEEPRSLRSAETKILALISVGVSLILIQVGFAKFLPLLGTGLIILFLLTFLIKFISPYIREIERKEEKEKSYQIMIPGALFLLILFIVGFLILGALGIGISTYEEMLEACY